MILLVEDNQDDELLTLRALNKHHISSAIVVARNGVEALDYLFGGGPRFAGAATAGVQLVLLDLNLPLLSGVEVLKRIRADERTRFVPVIVLTSSREDQDILDCYASGANAYVRKPVDFREFCEMASTIGRFWVSLNERVLP